MIQRCNYHGGMAEKYYMTKSCIPCNTGTEDIYLLNFDVIRY